MFRSSIDAIAAFELDNRRWPLLVPFGIRATSSKLGRRAAVGAKNVGGGRAFEPCLTMPAIVGIEGSGPFVIRMVGTRITCGPFADASGALHSRIGLTSEVIVRCNHPRSSDHNDEYG